MSDARAWSERIASWAIEDRRQGERIYLSVDSGVLDEIGADLGGFEGFLAAVRRQLRVPSEPGWREVPGLVVPPAGARTNGVPDGTAFLALLVITAGQMGEPIEGYEGKGDGGDFFPWLRKLLGGCPISERKGLGELSQKPEVALWSDWATFLAEKGYRSVETEDLNGKRRYINYALDQAILTAACRRHLRRQSHQRLTTRIAIRNARRPVGLLRGNLPKHLEKLLEERWDEPQVQEAVLGAMEGAPSGARPGRHHLSLVRCGPFAYELRLKLPQRWRGAKVIALGRQASAVPVTPAFPEVSFRIVLGQAEELVTWRRPPCLRFPASEWVSGTMEEREAELNEPHLLVTPASLLPALNAARTAGACAWDREPHLRDGWVELADFRQKVPVVVAGDVELRVRSSGGVVFEGGVRTGERDGVVRLFRERSGGVRAVEVPGQAKVLDGRGKTIAVLDLAPDRLTPLPGLSPQEYHLEFCGHRIRFEIVPWRQVTYAAPSAPAWLT